MDVRENIMLGCLGYLSSSSLSPDQMASDLLQIITSVRSAGYSVIDITNVKYIDEMYEVKISHIITIIVERKMI